MKKSLLLIPWAVCAMMLPTASFADGHGWGHGWGHHHHHHGYGPAVSYYYPQPQVNYYYPAQPVVNYYAPPPVVYQAPPPPPVAYYPGGGRPSTNGLAGGVIGGVLGYQFGSGDPLSTGIGAAAGSYLGNGFGGY